MKSRILNLRKQFPFDKNLTEIFAETKLKKGDLIYVKNHLGRWEYSGVVEGWDGRTPKELEVEIFRFARKMN